MSIFRQHRVVSIALGARPSKRAGSVVFYFRLALIPLLLVFSGSVDGTELPVTPRAPREQHQGASGIHVRVHIGDPGRRDAAGSGYPLGLRQNSPADAAVPDPVLFAAEKTWLWYALLSAVLLIAMVLFFLLALGIRRALRDDLSSTRPSKAARALAFLESQDGSSQRHAVASATYRIGRHSDNDLSIHDSSVSRQHAEINLRRSGSFTITDLDSMNGVFVNQRKIDSVILADGDIIEIGDKSFRFRLKQNAGPSGD